MSEAVIDAKVVKNIHGFTLLELLIAIFIFAVVVSSVYGTYTTTFKVVANVESETEVHHRARIALERIAEDLESVYQVSAGTMEGESQDIDSRRADTLKFVTRAHLNLGSTDPDPKLATVQYSVESDDETGLFRLYRADTLMTPDVVIDPDEKGFLLCDTLWEVRFTYFDETGAEEEDWDSSSGSSSTTTTGFPVMIQISLRFANSSGDGEGTLFTTAVALGKTSS